MGFPVSTSIKVPARTYDKVQTSTAHAVEEWSLAVTFFLSFLNFAGSKYCRSADNQRQYLYVIFSCLLSVSYFKF